MYVLPVHRGRSSPPPTYLEYRRKSRARLCHFGVWHTSWTCRPFFLRYHCYCLRSNFRALRKSDPANLALLGTLVSSLSKCFLLKAIFEYMVQSARAKKARLAASARMMGFPASTKPAVHLVSSLRAIRAKQAERNHGVVPTESPDDITSIKSGKAEHSCRSVTKPDKIKGPGKEEGEERINARGGGQAEEKKDPDISLEEVVQFEQENSLR